MKQNLKMLNKSTSLAVIIPAAGVGKRMQANCPKQYLKIAQKTILEYTLERFLKHSDIQQIILPLSLNDAYFSALQLKNNPNIIRVEGGKERADSVLSGLKYLVQNGVQDDAWVLVHDAARPCIRRNDISRLIEFCQQLKPDDKCQGAVLGVKVKDTMKRTQFDQIIAQTVERQDLWHAQTPQMFRLGTLIHALTLGLTENPQLGKNQTITDEASAMELAGYQVAMIEGHGDNLKVTTPEDLALANYYLAQNLNEYERE